MAYLEKYKAVVRLYKSMAKVVPGLLQATAASTPSATATPSSGCNTDRCGGSVTVKCSDDEDTLACNRGDCTVQMPTAMCKANGVDNGDTMNCNSPRNAPPPVLNAQAAFARCAKAHECKHAGDNPNNGSPPCRDCDSEQGAYTAEADCLAQFIRENCGNGGFSKRDCNTLKDDKKFATVADKFNKCLCDHANPPGSEWRYPASACSDCASDGKPYSAVLIAEYCAPYAPAAK